MHKKCKKSKKSKKSKNVKYFRHNIRNVQLNYKDRCVKKTGEYLCSRYSVFPYFGFKTKTVL